MTPVGGDPLRPTVAEIDTSAIAANVRRIAGVAGVPVCAVVKADGYGHGAVRAAHAAVKGGATWVAVALVEEGEQLREVGIDVPILLLAEPPEVAAPRLRSAGLTPTVYSREMLRALDGLGRDAGRPVDIHVKADTGMHRVGVPRDDWAGFLDAVAASRGVRVTGLMTHLARADEPDVDTSDRQLDAFDDFIAMAAQRDIRPEVIHAANTAGALIQPRSRHDLVRAGIGIYGLSPSPDVTAAGHGLQPALTWRTRVSFAKRVKQGDAASYGHRWSAPADGWLATLPVGYADGVPRLVGGRVDVLVEGRRQPLVGTVCMDQVVVWCGDTEARRDDDVILIGSAGGASVSADEWAAAAETITYEISCGISRRVPRMLATEQPARAT